LGERIKVRGHELSIRRSIIYTNINNKKIPHASLLQKGSGGIISPNERVK
jgi:hypothetical protein